MVTKLAEIEPRSSGEMIVPNEDNPDGDFFHPELSRTVYIVQNDLDVYCELDVAASHSADPNFNNSLRVKEGLPVRPDTVREFSYTGSNEIVELMIDTPSAPSSGSVTIWQESDHTPMHLESEMFNEFLALNEGRAYAVDFQESLADAATITVGIDVPSDIDSSVFVQQFGLSVGGDALVTTAIDHGSYSDGSSVSVINKKPELQIERPIESSVTKNPTVSNPQVSMTAFLPGGSAGGTSIGGRFTQTDYELQPGQNMIVQIQNDSGSSNRYGFSLELVETVIR